MNDDKLWWKSKTVWVNVLTVVLAIISLASVQTWLTREILEVFLFLSGVLNIILRFLTDQPLLPVTQMRRE